MKESDFPGYIVILIFLLGIVMWVFAMMGCSAFNHKPETTPVVSESPSPQKQLYDAAKKSNWLVTLSILGIAVGVFALVNGSVKLGTASIASASVSLFMSLAVARFALWMAVFGLIGSAIAALFSILARRKALVEIIRGVQVYKDRGVHTTGLGAELDKQANTTKKIVGSIKNKLKLKGAI